MTLKMEEAKAGYVRRMFAGISSDYDFMNRLMTFGMDRSWRRFLLSKTILPRGGLLLDVGTGTGDIAFEAIHVDPTLNITGIDFTPEMMQVGRSRKGAERINWCLGDALCLPFPDAVFDAVVSGFLVRNVADVRSVIMEQVRVVRPGGWVVCLDTSPGRRNILRPVIDLYLKVLIPFLGRLLTGKGAAYRYLAKSTINFLEPHALLEIMNDIGLKDVEFKRLMFGNIAVHWGMRPLRNQEKQ